MAQIVIMPKLSQTMEEGSIVKWRKQEGDVVRKGDIIFEIETDKAVIEVESFFEGTLIKIVVPEGQVVPVAATVGFIGKAGEKAPDVIAPPPAAAPAPAAGAPATPAPTAGKPAAPPPVPSAQPAARPAAPVVAVPATPARKAISPRARALIKASAIAPDAIRGTGPESRVVEADVRAYLEQHHYADLRISPAAKQLAITQGVDVLQVQGSGDGGRIMSRDIELALAERPKPMSRMRQVIAQRLTDSFTSIPHFYVTVQVDMTDLLAFRQTLKAAGKSFTVTDFVLEAVILSLQEFPALNSSTDGRTTRWRSHVNLGMAVALEQGLVVPVIRNAETLTLAELREASKTLAAKARDGKLLPDEMTGSSFTVSNMGMMNVENFSAIINPGESAILAVASTIPQPAVRDGKIVVRSLMKITASSDHRIVDGMMAANFVNCIKAKLEDIELWKSLTLS